MGLRPKQHAVPSNGEPKHAERTREGEQSKMILTFNEWRIDMLRGMEELMIIRSRC